jgi:chromosomal replication initiation ATPase DnaA
VQTTRGYATQMKTLTQLKQAMKAPMYSELNSRELLLYKTGFKNGYRMSMQQNQSKLELNLLRLKIREERFDEKKAGGSLTGIYIDKKKIHASTFEAVVNKVCIQYELNKKEVLGNRRFSSLVRIRSIIINLMIELHKVSLSQLGRMFGMDHSTIIHHRAMKFNRKRFWSSEKTIHEEFKKLKQQLTI